MYVYVGDIKKIVLWKFEYTNIKQILSWHQQINKLDTL